MSRAWRYFGSTIDELVGDLRNTIVTAERPPYCSGTLTLSPEDFVLFFGKENEGLACRIDLANASEEALKKLAETCDPATFGVNQMDVLDDTYRKAGKLNAEDFATKLDVVKAGLVDAVRYNLFEGVQSKNIVRSELYKLNVYGKDSFFKAHKDTPRAANMFGSLVIVFPTAHEGGALLLRKDEKEWTFDSAKAIAEAEQPAIAYIAFYSDTEHEVTKVESGYRVTTTYNLYFEEDEPLSSGSADTITLPIINSANKNAFRDELKRLLAMPSFFPSGGHLAFGLHHQYPIDREWEKSPGGVVSHLVKYLKGTDALIVSACHDLSLHTQLAIVYQDEYEHIVMKMEPDFVSEWGYGEEGLTGWLETKFGHLVIDKLYRKECHDEFCWITDPTKFNELRSTYMAYGNESSLGYCYANLCLLVKVGPQRSRSTRVDE